MISGAGVEELKSPQGQLMRRVMVNSIGFILGFSWSLSRWARAATEIGQVLGNYKQPLAREAGVVIIIFGLHLTGMFKIKALYTDARLHSVKGSSTPIGLRGRLRFRLRMDAVPWADFVRDPDCRRRERHVGKGILLLAVYSLGLAMPFLLTRC